MLPLLFNRMTPSADSTYGFNKSSFETSIASPLGPSADVEAKIGAFRRILEKDGLVLAVAIVVNGSRISSRLKSSTVLQQGFSLYNDNTTKAKSILSETDSSTFPAIYFQESTPTSSPRLLRIRRTSNSSKDELQGEEKETTCSQKNSQNLQGSTTVWSHTSWPNPLPLLTSEKKVEKEFKADNWQWIQADAQTLLHPAAINCNMWFVVMIKASDESQWSRCRRNKLLEKDAEDVFIEIVSTLRLSDVFKQAIALEIRHGSVRAGSSFNIEACRRMLLGTNSDGHSNFMELLRSFKEEIGLRHARQRELVDLSQSFGNRSGRVGRTLRNPLRNISSGLGHYAFFLGEELTNTVLGLPPSQYMISPLN
jgi:hypothetical protein